MSTHSCVAAAEAEAEAPLAGRAAPRPWPAWAAWRGSTLCQKLAPWRQNKAVPVSFPAVLMHAGLVSRHHEALFLYGSGSQQGMPVRSASNLRERSRQHQNVYLVHRIE